MTKILEYLKTKPLVTAALALVISVASILCVPQDSYLVRLLLRVLMCGTMLFLLWLISGEKTLSQGNNRTGFVIKTGLAFWVYAALSGLVGLLPKLLTHEQIPAGWPLRLVVLLFMFLFACLFEELCFRAILNDAIVCHFRNSRHVFALSAVFTSLCFGVVHCLGSSLGSVSEWLQAGMKTLECALFGFSLLVLYWKTRNIWACGLLHAGFDILTSVPTLIYETNAKIGAGTYVTADGSGSAHIIMYIAIIVVCALIAWRVWRKVGRTIDFEQMRRTW